MGPSNLALTAQAIQPESINSARVKSVSSLPEKIDIPTVSYTVVTPMDESECSETMRDEDDTTD